MSTRKEEFDGLTPPLSEAEITEAAAKERRVLSFTGSRVEDEDHKTAGVVIKFRLANGEMETMIFDVYSFGILKFLSEAVDAVNSAIDEASGALKN